MLLKGDLECTKSPEPLSTQGFFHSSTTFVWEGCGLWRYRNAGSHLIDLTVRSG